MSVDSQEILPAAAYSNNEVSVHTHHVSQRARGQGAAPNTTTTIAQQQQQQQQQQPMTNNNNSIQDNSSNKQLS